MNSLEKRFKELVDILIIIIQKFFKELIKDQYHQFLRNI